MIKTVLVFASVVFFVVFLMPFGITAMLLYFLGFKKPMIWFIYKLAQYWGLITIAFTGSSVKVTGRENIPEKGGVCFVSNHCGYFDIILLLAYCGRPFGFVAKKELLFLPLINAWIYMLGGLFIDRKSARKAVKTISKGVNKIKNGGGMLIFPEGHRSKGRGLLPFHPGSLKLATQAEAVIVPVAIKGSYDVFEKTYRVKSSNAAISFCPSIDTAALPLEDKKQVLCDRIYAVIKEELEKENKG